MSIRTDLKRLSITLASTCFALCLLSGCDQPEKRVAPPNESTAAPARLPGEDPHSRTATATDKTRK